MPPSSGIPRKERVNWREELYRVKEGVKRGLARILHLEKPPTIHTTQREVKVNIHSGEQLTRLEQLVPGIKKMLAQNQVETVRLRELIQKLLKDKYKEHVVPREEVMAKQENEFAMAVIRQGFGYKAPKFKVYNKKYKRWIHRYPVALSHNNTPIGEFLGVWHYNGRYYPVLRRGPKKYEVFLDGVGELQSVYVHADTLKGQIAQKMVQLAYTETGKHVPSQYKEG